MAIRVALNHKTQYHYDRAVLLSPQVIRLRPAPHNRTPIHKYSLTIQPAGHFINWQQDPHGNYLARVVFPERTTEFSVEVDLVADLEAYSPFDFFLDPSAMEYPFTYSKATETELQPYLKLLEPTPRLNQFIEGLSRKKQQTVDFLVEINRAVHRRVQYVIRMEPGVQTPEETLQLGKGSCRDSAWLLAQVLRRMGVASRFVSGYLIQLTADQKPVEGPEGPTQDFTDLHAWCECYVPGAGWIGLDPTSGLLTAEGHIPLASTPVPATAAPIEGGVEKAETEFGFEMTVSRVVDRPRVTKPYTDEQWQGILELGDKVDRDLNAADVRLSSGGEPTFVASDEPDQPEWNTAAMGGNKEAFADRLLRRLHPLWGPGGVLHHGQGKWYPGEQLPRWAYTCYWRTDGVPVWENPILFGESGRNYGHTAVDAERFLRELVTVLGVQKHGLMPVYEDAWYYAWRERRLPANVDPLDSRLDDAEERARLERVFTQGLPSVVGWALPLRNVGRWESGDWFLRRERCFLLPGDSPMGFRLPIDSLPWVHVEDWDGGNELDPSVARSALPRRFEFPPRADGSAAAPAQVQLQRRYRTLSGETVVPDAKGEGRALKSRAKGPLPTTLGDPFTAPLPGESALGVTRTAICAEPRDGLLRIFLPPMVFLEGFLELIAAIEVVATRLGIPVQLEGYPPPRDPRLMEFKVTPDPGVLEINVPPLKTWRGVVTQTEQLYEAARQEKLVAEKFDIDGAHIGSGGGNHVVLGGMTQADSPFLRRPDLLASLVRYWHNHPSLSYLFAGRFIGPTSQAPRVDEARNDAVYELELAFDQLPKKGQTCPPWLVDRVLRNLLVDVAGNTHRAEFCIDKLFSPDGPTGRLGLVEMRAFEMPPHERMSAVQQLLVRSLLSAFWQKPYEQELIKWGTALHDRFMLPYYTAKDFAGVIGDLANYGYPVDAAWFAPHFEFRYPLYGSIKLDTMEMEVRAGLEPWPVLGEESAAGGQARYVDSSLERLQVEVRGFLEERYRIACNGYVIPMAPTGTNGHFVGAVRYRAWQPPSCLHPTIGIHSPLRIDIYDTWSKRSVAGATYHVVHPGGRSSEVRPVNAAAAESRRLARFERQGHMGGPRRVVNLPPHPHFPHTLDLRRASLAER
jgi:uncharacterized protein (DUF2126 family)/transglutaminase-like putative cysteine protease